MKKVIALTSMALGLCLFNSNILNAADSQVSTQNVTMTVNGSSLIRVDGGAVSLALSGASTAGAAVTATATNSDTRLSISSLTQGTDKNKISAAVTSASTMASSNTELYLRLLPPTVGAPATDFVNLADAGGTYPFGTSGDAPAGARLIGSTSIDVVTGIGTCWSGTNVGDGYIIEYTYKTLGTGTPQNRSITITYTISPDI